MYKNLFFLFSLLLSSLVMGEEQYNNNYYTSSNSVEGLLQRDQTVEKYDLSLSADYHLVAFGASNSIGKDSSLGGVARIFGEWQFINVNTPNKGSLMFKVENRHKINDIAPFDFSTEVGYAGLLQSTYTDQGNRLTVLYYKQNYFDGRLTTYIGYLDSTEYLDIYLLISPWNAFGNLVFATGSATIAGMPDGALGAMGAYWISDTMYVVGSIVDANGDPTKPWDGFESMFGDFETLKTLEFGWTTSKEKLFFDNLHITLWQIDEREEAQISEGYGVSFSLTHTLSKEFLLFFRGGYSKDGGAILSKSLSGGFGYMAFGSQDIIGVGVNWGEPNSELFSDVKEQYTSEIFYRYQAGKHFQITPSLQLIADPALNTEENFVTIFGLRVEATF